MASHPDDFTLRLFLLGCLPEAEREDIERAALESAEFFECIEALEQELILDYVQGRLTSADRSAFESAYRQTPEQPIVGLPEPQR